MTTHEEVRAIAGKLTKAQRSALVALPLLVDGRALAEPRTKTVCGALRRAGLTRIYSAAYDALTPLGLAVRSHLKDKTNVD